MIKPEQPSCIPLVQQAIDLLKYNSCWEDEAALTAHILGLQGEKRRERYEARKDHILVQHLRHEVYDLFDMRLHPEEIIPEMPEMKTIDQFLQESVKQSWATYHELHEIANKLVVAGYKPLASPLYEHVECLHAEIIELRRLRKEYNLANQEYHHISRYEVGYHNVHDYLEAKEKAQGYT